MTARPGTHFLQVVERLGVAAPLRNVLRGYDTSDIEYALSTGAVQYVTAGVATLRALAGVGEVVPLPAAFQRYTTYMAGVRAMVVNVTGARSFLAFLASQAARESFISHGLELDTP